MLLACPSRSFCLLTFDTLIDICSNPQMITIRLGLLLLIYVFYASYMLLMA
jgi:hypothetical protein